MKLQLHFLKLRSLIAFLIEESPVSTTPLLLLCAQLAKGSIFHIFPGSLAGKESARNAGDLGSILGLGSSPGEGKGNPLQYSGLENSMDCIVHRVEKSLTKSQT